MLADGHHAAAGALIECFDPATGAADVSPWRIAAIDGATLSLERAWTFQILFTTGAGHERAQRIAHSFAARWCLLWRPS